MAERSDRVYKLQQFFEAADVEPHLSKPFSNTTWRNLRVADTSQETILRELDNVKKALKSLHGTLSRERVAEGYGALNNLRSYYRLGPV